MRKGVVDLQPSPCFSPHPRSAIHTDGGSDSYREQHATDASLQRPFHTQSSYTINFLTENLTDKTDSWKLLSPRPLHQTVVSSTILSQPLLVAMEEGIPTTKTKVRKGPTQPKINYFVISRHSFAAPLAIGLECLDRGWGHCFWTVLLLLDALACASILFLQIYLRIKVVIHLLRGSSLARTT